MTDPAVMHIISVLKTLECPFLKDSTDAWIIEILFKSSLEKYQLIEWIFSKLEISLPDVGGNHNSTERKIKNLLSAVSALGLCDEEDQKIIEGTAPLRKQKRFWSLLTDILQEKMSYTAKEKNGRSVSGISDEFERNCNYIHKFCQDVNIKHLFETEMQLFPSQLLKESKEVCKSLSPPGLQTLDEIKMLANARLKNHTQCIYVENPLSENFASIDDSSMNNDDINDFEAKIDRSLTDFRNHANTDFKDAYLSLKPQLVTSSHDDFVDAGPSFKAAKVQLESVAKLNGASSKLQESNSRLKTLCSDLENFNLSLEPLSDTLLREYLTILEDLKKEIT